MTTITDFELSGAGFLVAVIAASLLFLAFRLLRRLPAVLLPKGKYRSVYQRLLPVAETLVWILFTVWALGFIFVDSASRGLALLTLLLVSMFWLSWFAAKDFIAGVVLRLQDAYEVGQHIHLNDIEGSVLRVGFLGMDVERKSGQVTRIPYSKITGAVHSRSLPTAPAHHSFQVAVPKGAPLDETMNRIRESALISPWSFPDTEPQVRRVSETDDAYTLEVALSGIGQDQFEAIERDIRRHLRL